MKMLNDVFEGYLARLGLPLLGQNHLREVRSKAPSRRVKHGHSNVNVFYPSQKMGVVLQAESRTCEFPFLVVKEHDRNVLEIWDQPLEMKISYTNAKGIKVGPGYTADYLILERTRVLAVECKLVSELNDLVKDEPGKFVFENGRFRCPPAEEAARLRGFVHIIHTEVDLVPVLFRNLMYLSDYTLETTLAVPDWVQTHVEKELSRKPGLLLSELRLACPEQCSRTAFVDYTNTLIAQEIIQVDLEAAPLEAPDEVHVFPSKEQVQALGFLSQKFLVAAEPPVLPTLSIGAELQWGQRVLKVENIISDEVTCSSPGMPMTTMRYEDLKHLISAGQIKAVASDGNNPRYEKAHKKLLSTPPKYLKIANKRFRAILPYLTAEQASGGPNGENGDQLNIRSLKLLARRLQKPTDADRPAQFIAGQISPGTKHLLANFCRRNAPELRQALAEDLADIVRKCPVDAEQLRGSKPPETSSHPAEENSSGTGFAHANRLLLLEAFPKELTTLPEMDRSVRRWLSCFRRAELNFGYGLLGLIPDYNKCGNRKGKLSEATKALLEEVFVNEFKTRTNPSRAAFFRIFITLCGSRGVDKKTRKTVYKWLKQRIDYEALLKRVGPRGVYAQKPFAPTVAGLEPKAEFPWHRCHIDHTLLDARIIIGYKGTEVQTEKVWCSALFDDYSRRVLAMIMLLDPPSYRTCMLLLRECFNRWQRLPQTIIVDNGKELKSTYFETLLAYCFVIKEERPPHEPRFGSGVERFFGTLNTLWLHQLKGNTKLMKNPRQVTKSFSPEKLAVWPFDEFAKEAERAVYEVYDQRPGSNNAASPKELFDQGLEDHGMRPSRIIDAETFRFLVLPAPDKETRTVRSGRGIKLNGLYYCCKELQEPAMAQKTVLVRYDPLDMSKVYVYCANLWQKAECRVSQDLRNVSERRLRLASRLYRHQRRNAANAQEDYEAQLGAFLVSCRDKELELQAIRDRLQAGGSVIEKNTLPKNVIPLTQPPHPEEVADAKPPTVSKVNEETYGDF